MKLKQLKAKSEGMEFKKKNERLLGYDSILPEVNIRVVILSCVRANSCVQLWKIHSGSFMTHDLVCY